MDNIIYGDAGYAPSLVPAGDVGAPAEAPVAPPVVSEPPADITPADPPPQEPGNALENV